MPVGGSDASKLRVRAALAALVWIAGAPEVYGRRVKNLELDVNSRMATDDEYEKDSEASTSLQLQGVGPTTCEYAGMIGVRPPNQEMISVCLGGRTLGISYSRVTEPCLDHARNAYGKRGKYVLHYANELTMADCAQLCTTGKYTNADGEETPIEALGTRTCAGYVLRQPFASEPAGVPYCFLLPSKGALQNATISYDRSDKKTVYMKQSCDCGTRYVHFKRPRKMTALAITKVAKKQMVAELALKSLEYEESTNEKRREELDKEIKEINLAIMQYQTVKDSLKADLALYKQMSSLGGIYDFFPVSIPDRITKTGMARNMPTGMFRFFKGMSSLGKEVNNISISSDAFESPVRISHVYKKLDMSAILYKCYDKVRGDKKDRSGHWYLASVMDLGKEARFLLEGAGDRLPTDAEIGKLKELLQDSEVLQARLFFSLRCIGHRVGGDNVVHHRDSWRDGLLWPGPETDIEIHPDSLSDVPSQGCFRDVSRALKKQDELVVEDVLRWDAIGQESKQKLLENNICRDLVVNPKAEALAGLDMAKWFTDNKKYLKVAVAGKEAWDAVSSNLGGLFGFFGGGNNNNRETTLTTTTTTTTTASTTAFARIKNLDELADRAKVLVGAIKEVLMRTYAIGDTDDEYLKIFCAREMLEFVQNAGGIWPKIAQNLAVRPDLIENSFAREKLKETQSGNKNRGREATVKYLQEVQPVIVLPDGTIDKRNTLMDILQYKRFLSAGSVGQVDIWEFKPESHARFLKEAMPAHLQSTMAVPQVIVKTVFNDTEDEYKKDWSLLEKVFHHLRDQIPEPLTVVWRVIKSLEASIFDEFNMELETTNTKRGHEMIEGLNKEMADRSKGRERPYPRITTPVALHTTSRYVMIQTIAAGKPLKDYLEQVKGQWSRLVEWRLDIYYMILTTFGYTAIQHGFFQADPHPGNWFWDTDNRVLTLIDWGGVEDWTRKDAPATQEAHCNLAWLYHSMGHMVKAWDRCDNVLIDFSDGSGKQSTPKSSKFRDEFYDIRGEYVPRGFSLFHVQEGEEDIAMGFNYAVSYRNHKKSLDLWMDGEHWVVGHINMRADQVATVIARLKAPELSGDEGRRLAIEAPLSRIVSTAANLPWDAINPKTGKVVAEGHKLRLGTASGVCHTTVDRVQGYALAAKNLGFTLKTPCEDMMFLGRFADYDTDPDLLPTKAFFRTDDKPMVCIKGKGEKKTGTVGVPPQAHPILEAHGKKFLKVDIPLKANVEETKVVLLQLHHGEEVDISRKVEIAQRGRPTMAEAALNGDGIGSGLELPKLEMDEEANVYRLAEKALAFATALFDSDVSTAAQMGLQGRQSLAIFEPDSIPQVYTQFARSGVVIQGMLLDVVKDNLLRLVPVDKLQWLIMPYEDRFFEAWSHFARNHLTQKLKAGQECPDAAWLKSCPRCAFVRNVPTTSATVMKSE